MKMKKILASVVAAALAVSAIAVSAFAEADGAKKVVTVKSVREPYAKVCISAGPDAGDVDVNWVVATEDNDAAYKGKTTITSVGWWDEKDVTVAELIGEVEPDDVKSITFSSDVNFTVGYNKADGWGQGDTDKEDFVVTDMLLTPIEVDEDVEVNILVEDEYTASAAGGYVCVIYNGAAEEGKVANVTIKDTDVLAVSVTAPAGVDTSKMTLQFKGYDSSWSKGWDGPTSEEGALTFKATVKEILDIVKFEKAEDLFGVNLEIYGLEADAKVSYKVGTTVSVEVTDIPDEPNVSASEEPNVSASEEPNVSASEEPNVSSSEEPNVSASEDATTTSGVAGNVNGGDTGDKNQPTGLVLAVVPAAVAAAAVVIAKKRK